MRAAARPLAAAAEDGAQAALTARAQALLARYGQLAPPEILAAMIGSEFPGEIALISSFGAEAAPLLHMVAAIDPAVPIIFLDTGKLFGETLRYRDALVARLGLTDVRSVRPDPERVARFDPDGVLWYGNPDMCCYIRKVEPLHLALAGFAATITGRKAFHGGERTGLQPIEAMDDGRIRINPLAGWTRADLDAYFARHDLPRHPLEADGFVSIGCMPCTDRVAPGEDARAGRWRGRSKNECGIHLPLSRLSGLERQAEEAEEQADPRWRVLGID